MIKLKLNYLLVFTAVTLSAFLGGGNLPFYLFYCMVFILLFNVIYALILYFTIKIDVNVVNQYYQAGDQVKCNALVRCSIAIPYLQTNTSGQLYGDKQYQALISSITKDKDQWLHSNIVFHQRGIYDLGMVSVKARDILQMIEFKKTVHSQNNIKVYPKIHKIKKLSFGNTDIYQDEVNLNSNIENPFMIKDIRKYSPGDSLKKIHWKISAKYQQLYVKNYDRISGPGICFFVNMNAVNYDYDKDGIIEEQVVDGLVSMVNAIRNDIDTSLFINAEDEISIQIRSAQDFNQLLERLLTLKSGGHRDFAYFMQKSVYALDRMNKLIVLTAVINNALYNELLRIKNSGYSVTLIYCFEDEANLTAELKRWGVDCLKMTEIINVQKDSL